MRQKKSQSVNQLDPEWIKVIADALLDINIYELSDSHKKMLQDLYLENLRKGLKPKDAISKALQIVKCFKT